MISLAQLLWLGLYVLLMSSPTKPSKILFLMPLGPMSHKNFFDGVVRALAKADHQVTIVSGVNQTLNEPNVKNIILEEDKLPEFAGNPFEKSMVDIVRSHFNYGAGPCIDALLNPKVQKALLEDYDLLMISIIMTECFLPTIYEKKVPFVYVTPILVFASYSPMMGNLEFPSIVPNLALEASYPLTFGERMIGAVGSAFMDLLMQYSFNPRIESQCREIGLWPDDIPSLNELQRSASLAICNIVMSLEYPARPSIPSVIFAGGVHIEPPKALPKELEDWIETSGDDGFILFSLGSVTKTTHMKEEHRKIFVKVFSELKQKVFWKWDSGVMMDLPRNVKVSKWLPQRDILAHPKIRLFITHGGLLSTLEATHYGVPILGMAVFADQHSNVQRAHSEGWASKIHWDELTEEVLRETIKTALHDPRMKQVAVQRSHLMRDRPRSPAEEIVYWVEYVIRHKGAEHLKCPFASMSWIEIYNLDVWFVVAATLLSISISCIFCIAFCIRFFIRSCRSTAPSAKRPPISKKGDSKTIKKE